MMSEEDNSYMEPSYDEADQSSDSYEPTFYRENRPIKELLTDDILKKSSALEPGSSEEDGV